jgi:rod shape-determining protein MreC
MRNLIQFLNRYSFFFLFLFFEVIAFYILIRHNNFHQSRFFTSSNYLSGRIYTTYSNFTDYINLKQVNEDLLEENRRLKERQIKSFDGLYGENIMINDTIYQRKYLYSTARIINNSTNKQRNYLTLNTGSENGVKPGMGVVGSTGVIGVIQNVSPHFSTVLSVLHINSSISAKVEGSDYFGSLKWEGKSYREGILEDIPNHVQLTIGDTIVTSGFSATFPPGIDLATIADIIKPEGENFYTIKVNFIVDYKNISQVYVIKNIMKREQQELENQLNHE